MKELNINRDVPQPSDDDLLKHQNFEEVLKKASHTTTVETGNLVSKKWWYFGVGLFVVAGVFVSTIIATTFSTKNYKKNYTTVNQDIVEVNKLQEVDLSILNNILTIENNTEIQKESDKNEFEQEEIEGTVPIKKVVQIYYPKEASTLTFKLEESFGLKSQYQKFEEFSIYSNLSFQPIGDYQSGWLKASWSEVQLVKKSDNYFLMLSKNGITIPCQVVPVFESEDYVNALDIYAANAGK